MCQMNVKKHNNFYLYDLCHNLLFERTLEAETNYINYINSLYESNKVSKFLELLIKDFDYYLPSKVDCLYHRDTLSSNVVETSFSTLKNCCNRKKQPLMTVLEHLLRISMKWLFESCNVTCKVPSILQGLIDINVGKKSF